MGTLYTRVATSTRARLSRAWALMDRLESPVPAPPGRVADASGRAIGSLYAGPRQAGRAFRIVTSGAFVPLLADGRTCDRRTDMCDQTTSDEIRNLLDRDRVVALMNR